MNRVEAGNSKSGWIFLGIFLVCAALIKPAQDLLEARRGDPGPDADLLYFSSPSMVKRMALSYGPLLADFYWLRTIQYYGRREEADRRLVRYKNLPALLDITTTLDPDLIDAYRSGSVFLGEEEPLGAGKPLESLKLLDKGIRMHPQDWRLRYDKGFVYYWYLKDYRNAGDTWREAGRLQNAPHWLEPLAAMALSKGGAVDVAAALWQIQYQNSTRADVRENARNHLFSLEAMRDIWTFEFLLEKYRAEHGSYPRTLGELVRGKAKPYRLLDPTGTPYEYNPATGTVSLSSNTTMKYLEVPNSYKEQFLARIQE